ncbi:RCC1 domain-containing protein [Frankia sp. R82]|uniref:RCC1 domain-containing protein n=1 Tax=Frankia sp. R82 TaxID=2950553 RepID=UPI0020448FCF|nr:RCC1 domain-containing protein [Frankia sp. R82]MCM3882884.1 RCC1 domain-containing protein [Frankia sp. R82]
MYGQLGDGTTTDASTPVRVAGLTGVTAISGGRWAGYALRTDGTVRAWARTGTASSATAATRTGRPP